MFCVLSDSPKSSEPQRFFFVMSSCGCASTFFVPAHPGSQVTSGRVVRQFLDLQPSPWSGLGIFRGETVLGLAEGRGEWVGTGTRRGDSYKGDFSEGLFEGEGVYTDRKGVVWYSGRWRKGFNLDEASHEEEL